MNRPFWAVTALVCAAVLVLVPAGAATTRVLTLANISNDAPDTNGDNEVDIAINPTNPQNLIAAWNDYGRGSCGLGYSADGGKTWTTDWLRGVTPAGGNPTF